jgi:hypothetical protein
MRTALVAACLFSTGVLSHAEAASLRWFHLPTFHDVRAYVTGYNTTPGQTDDTPCIAASGGDICGRTDVVACPRRISLGTYLQIRGATYICEDRLAKKFDTRFDISCDKDTTCPGQVTGWAVIRVFGDDRRQPAATAPRAFASAAIARKPFAGAARRVAALRGRFREFRPA